LVESLGMEFIRENIFLIVFFPVLFVFLVVFLSTKKRWLLYHGYMERAEANTARHNAAVEAKLDRIIAILEKNQDSGNS
jgi:predicted membrane-bound mannosyltransferase